MVASGQLPNPTSPLHRNLSFKLTGCQEGLARDNQDIDVVIGDKKTKKKYSMQQEFCVKKSMAQKSIPCSRNFVQKNP